VILIASQTGDTTLKNCTDSPVISRRQIGQIALSSACAWAGLQGLNALAQVSAPAVKKPYLADMHSHYGMFLPRLFGFNLNKYMHEAGITLLAWSIVDDQRWIGKGSKGLTQGSIPAAGELWSYFQSRLSEYDGQLRQWGVSKALTPSDVDAALSGQPKVLLATEAANFLEGDVSRLAWAHDKGVRHLQLVHYIQSPLGDHQTAEPVQGGLTPLGARVVAECKRLGVVVDLAHGTAELVAGALDASDAAMVWSHSWIRPQGGTFRDVGWIARSLALSTAQKIAARGGVVGLWNLQIRLEPAYPINSIKTYADEIMRMSDLIGPEHVAFGTDMEGVWPGRLMTSYDDLREVADNLVKRGITESQLQDIFIGNYARVVKAAMRGAAVK
jgi:membrane dipeptidase